MLVRESTVRDSTVRIHQRICNSAPAELEIREFVRRDHDCLVVRPPHHQTCMCVNSFFVGNDNHLSNDIRLKLLTAESLRHGTMLLPFHGGLGGWRTPCYYFGWDLIISVSLGRPNVISGSLGRPSGWSSQTWDDLFFHPGRQTCRVRGST